MSKKSTDILEGKIYFEATKIPTQKLKFSQDFVFKKLEIYIKIFKSRRKFTHTKSKFPQKSSI